MSDCEPAETPAQTSEKIGLDVTAPELIGLRDWAAKMAAQDRDKGGQCGPAVLDRLLEGMRLFIPKFGREPAEAALIAGIQQIHPDFEMPASLRAGWRQHAITARRLAKQTYGPVQFVLPELIPDGVTILAGKPKTGKSWLALDLCLAVAGNRCTLGGLKPLHGDVLYLALEDSPQRLRRRIERLLGPPGAPWPERLTVATRWRRFDAAGRYDVAEWCSSVRAPRLVVIDTLAKIRPKAKGRHPHDLTDMTADELHRLVRERGVAVLAIHHTRKIDAEAIFDSLGVTGAADTVLVLARSAAGMVLHARGRDIDDSETAVRFDKTAGKWMPLGPAVDVRCSHERERIVEILAATGGEPLSVKEIMLAAGIRNRNAADLMLARMVAAREIERAGRGRYTLPSDDRKKEPTEAKDAHLAEAAREIGNLSNLSDLSDVSDSGEMRATGWGG